MSSVSARKLSQDVATDTELLYDEAAMFRDKINGT